MFYSFIKLYSIRVSSIKLGYLINFCGYFFNFFKYWHNFYFVRYGRFNSNNNFYNADRVHYLFFIKNKNEGKDDYSGFNDGSGNIHN